MSNRSAKFISAIFASFLAGAPLSTTSHSAVNTAEDCVPGPKGTPPQGGHWYYRVDRATKRNCWYIGEEKDKTARAAPRNLSSSAAAASSVPPQDNGVPKSVANARAELPKPQTRIEPDAVIAGRAPQQVLEIGNDRGAKSQDASPPRSLVASRWPESSAVSGAPDTAVPLTAGADAAPSNPRAAPPPALATVTLAAADVSAEKQFGSIQMLLIVLVSALSLAGLMGSAIYRFGGKRGSGRRGARRERRVNWDMAGNDHLPTAASTANDPHGRIAEMITRMSRSTAS